MCILLQLVGQYYHVSDIHRSSCIIFSIVFIIILHENLRLHFKLNYHIGRQDKIIHRWKKLIIIICMHPNFLSPGIWSAPPGLWHPKKQPNVSKNCVTVRVSRVYFSTELLIEFCIWKKIVSRFIHVRICAPCR